MTDANNEDLIEDSQMKKITRHEFYFETPLYSVVKDDDLEENLFVGEVDARSPRNKIETTYSIKEESVDYFSDSHIFRRVQLTCKRKGETLTFFVAKSDGRYVKVGQVPSLADIQFGDMDDKYGKVLDKENLFLLKRAVGLAAHGTGAGSFVYLRRIFEGLIKESYETNKDSLKISEKEFLSKRMDEKVQQLKSYLPDELSEMRPLYGLLSQGVHELTEEECLQYFPALKLSIELILDAKIEAQKKANRVSEVKSQIAAISSQIGEKKK